MHRSCMSMFILSIIVFRSVNLCLMRLELELFYTMFIFPFIFLFPVMVVWSLYRQPNTANQVVATPIEHYAH